MSAGGLPTPNFQDIRKGDTRLSWLQRTDANHSWRLHPDTLEPVGTAGEDDPLSAGYYFMRISESQFLHYQQQLYDYLPPMWPGIDNVQLGTPVELAESAVIDGPMDGILLAVTAVNPKVGSYNVDTFTSYFRGGYIIFISHEGHADTTQFIGPADGVLCPKGMTEAGSVVVVLNGAAQVTITPWLSLV